MPEETKQDGNNETFKQYWIDNIVGWTRHVKPIEINDVKNNCSNEKWCNE